MELNLKIDLNQLCGMKGIKREFSVPRTPQQNRIAGRKNRTLIKVAKTMLADSLLPIPFWAEAVKTACYVQNRVLVTKPQNKTPYELLLGRTPSIGFMRPFGCPVTILNTLNPLGKFDAKADEGFLVGYFNTDDDASFGSKKPEFEGEKLESEVHVFPSSKFEDFSDNSINEVNVVDSPVPAVGQISTNSTDTFSAAGPSNTTVSPTHGKSLYEELLQFKMQKVWVLVDMPNGKRAIGHTQEEGIDYEEVFDPVARIEATRLLLAYASFMGFMVYQMDVKSAFLYGTIEEEVYVCQPPGSKDPDYPDKWSRHYMDYIKLLELDGKSAITPIDTEKPLLKDPDGEDVDVHTCRSMIGSLMYLTSSRPDIMFAVCASIDCLLNEEIFTELSRMGYGKPSTKITFYKAFFSPQWKFLIHTILQCMSAKRTSWNEFSSSMASAVICLSTSRKFNFSMYIFDILVRNVDSSTKFYMYLRFLQLMIRTQVGDLSSHTTKYSSLALTQKQADDVADEGAAGVDVNVVPAAVEPSIPSPTPTNQPPPPSQELPSTSQVIPTPPSSPTAKPSSPPQQQQQPSQPTHLAEILMDLLHTLMETCTTLTRKVEALEQYKVAQALKIIKLKQRVKKLKRKNKLKVSRLMRLKKVGTAQKVESSGDTVMDDVSKQGEIMANMDADEDVTLKDVAVVAKEVVVEKDVEIEENADGDKIEPTELKEVVEVVTTAKLMTEVVTAASATIIAATTPITAATLTVAPNATRRRKGVVIRDPEETATPSIIIHSEPKSKDKRKGIFVEEPKPLKKQAQIEQDEAYARENMTGFKMDYFKVMSYDDIRLIFEKYFNLNVAFLEKTKEHLEEEESRALKRMTESQAEKAAKKQKLDEEVEELRKHLQIVPNDEDDVYAEATPLALKVPNVDYEIYTENNKPYYKIIRADGSPQLFLSFLSLLRNFDREDLEVL
nr:retrovirus-related Pol polyprotein from transposon TNT 1-94 [Tanacetum cinerariifolium]